MRVACVAAMLLAVASLASGATIKQFNNGDFQTGDLTGWTHDAGTSSVVANAGPNGAGDYALWCTNDWQNSLKASGVYGTDWPSGMTPGQQYTLQFDLKNMAPSAGKHMSFSVTNVSLGALSTLDIANLGNSTWQTFTLNFVAPSNGTVNVVVQGAGGGGKNLYLDNIKILPEPATMSILGLGLVGLLRRRR